MGSLDEILAQREKTHGNFGMHALVTQGIKRVMKSTPGWSNLPDSMKESLEMSAHKIGRILAGDPNVADHWDDIAGYSKLVGDAIRRDSK